MWLEFTWQCQSMSTLEEDKRRYSISWPIFPETATNWASPSTLLRLGPWGQIRSGSWRCIIAHKIVPSACSSHRGCNRTIFQMIPVYFWCIVTEVKYRWFYIFTLFLYKAYLLTKYVIFSSYLLLFNFCNCDNYFISQNSQLARFLKMWKILIVDYFVK